MAHIHDFNSSHTEGQDLRQAVCQKVEVASSLLFVRFFSPVPECGWMCVSIHLPNTNINNVPRDF